MVDAGSLIRKPEHTIMPNCVDADASHFGFPQAPDRLNQGTMCLSHRALVLHMMMAMMMVPMMPMVPVTRRSHRRQRQYRQADSGGKAGFENSHP